MQRVLEDQASGRITTGERMLGGCEELPQLVRGYRLATLCMGKTVIEHGAEYGGAKRTSQIACEQVRSRDATALRPIDDFLDQNKRAYTNKAHAKSHHEGPECCDDRRTLRVQQNEDSGPRRNEHAASDQDAPQPQPLKRACRQRGTG